MTTNDIINIMKEYPALTASGFDAEEDPEELLSFIDACNAACDWLSLVKRTKQPNPDIGSSYRLKHLAERKTDVYIPDGAFIAAALFMGFIYKQKPNTYSVYLNISSRTKIDGQYI